MPTRYVTESRENAKAKPKFSISTPVTSDQIGSEKKATK